MSAKLDMALDDVVMTERTARRRGRGGRRAPNAARKAAAPVGGIQKNTRPVRGALKPAVANGLAAGSGESKIIPTDVTEKNVKAVRTGDQNVAPFPRFCSPFLRPDAKRSRVEWTSLAKR
ncbi:MAG: hypothetical protein Q9169_008307 [Polycauliona sp. 2 TL-2023]